MSIRERVSKFIAPAEQKAADPSLFGLDWLVAGSTATSGVTVTAATAQRCAAVSICTSLLSNGVAIPCRPFRLVDGAKEEAADHPSHALVYRDATEWMDSAHFRAALTRDAILGGNGYAFVNRDLAGNPVELIRLSPSAVTLETDDLTGEPRYRIHLSGGGDRIETFSNILHVTSGIRADDGICGVGLVQLARDDIGMALVMQNAIATTFRNNQRPGGVLMFPTGLGEEALSKIRESWASGFSGENQGRTAILERGTEYKTVQMPLGENDAEKLLIQANVAVCKHFGVPPSLAFEMGRATWANLSEQNRHYIQYSVAPHLREWTAAYRRTLLRPEERDTIIFEFETDAFTKTDTLARWQSHQIARSSGVMTANEIRHRENLPRIDEPAADTLGNPYTTQNLAAEAPDDGA